MVDEVFRSFTAVNAPAALWERVFPFRFPSYISLLISSCTHADVTDSLHPTVCYVN